MPRPRLWHRIVGMAFTMQLLAWVSEDAPAQAVQAARGTTTDRVVESTTGGRAFARRVLDDATNAAALAREEADQEIRSALERVAIAARRVQSSPEHAFVDEYRGFARALDRACAVTAHDVRFAAFRAVAACTSVPEGGIAESTAQVPAIFNRVRDVVFTIGYEGAFERGDQPSYDGVSLGTNLLGAAVGTGFDALGSESLKNYFMNSLSAGVTIPSGSDTRMSGALGVGLGGIDFRGISFWPTLSFEQLDTADARVPRDLIADSPEESRWSQATIGVAIAYPRLVERVAGGQVGFILTLGLRLPHYYPGDTFSAVGAVFSSKRTDFRREGRSQFTIGVAVPLLKVTPIAEPAQNGGNGDESVSSPTRSP
jgi:hypothetical protein